MGYPVRYRGGRSPQRGPQTGGGDLPMSPGPYFGIALAYWAFGNLMQAVQGWGPNGQPTQQLPASYGWTLTLDCGHPQQRLPAAAFIGCGGETIISQAAYNSNATGAQNPLTASTLFYYTTAIRPFPPSGVWILRSARWDKGAGRPFSAYTYAPPGVLLGGPLPLRRERRAIGWTQSGYDVPALPVPGRLPGFDQLDDRWVTWYPGLPGSISRPVPVAPPIPRPVARAVPATGMREVKFNANTRAGRMFFAMYATFNLLGDGLGFTRALWFSIPEEHRGSSMRFRNMVKDIWRSHEHIDPLLAASNVAKWKFLDTLYGGTQAAMFKAIAAGYGHSLARVWATLESEINATTSFQRRRLEREQQSQRGG